MKRFPHPLPHLRVNVTLAQFELFQKTFGIEPGEGMHIAKEEVISIW